MSSNQIRPDRSDNNPHYRNSPRSSTSNQQRGSSATNPKPGPAGASSPFPSVTSNRSFKNNNNAQGGQSRAGIPTVNSSDSSHASTSRGLQNGSRMQHMSPGMIGAPEGLPASTITKPTELPASQKSSPSLPKVPTPQAATLSTDTSIPTTPSKASGDQLRPFSFQFGSISPGYVNKMPGNKMQIPARTSSAPPNLDEQKHDQARHMSHQTESHLPTLLPPKMEPHLPTFTPKLQVQRKDFRAVEQPDIAEAHSMPKPKLDVQSSPTLPTNQTQKPSVLSMSGIPMQIPFQQPQVPGSFGGASQQIQPQAMTATSLHMPPMPIPLQMGSTPQVQQQIYVSGLPPHPLHPQGTIHQGQNLGFTTQMGLQLPPQSGSLGINISSPQYPQQPGGKYVSQRKSSVRITDPKTREEVKFDSKRTDVFTDSGSSGSRSHPNMPPHTQPSYAQMNYYHNSYNHAPPFFPTPGSIPLTTSHLGSNSQAQHFNYPVNKSAQSVAFINPSALGSLSSHKIGSPMHGLPDPPILDRVREGSNVISPASTGEIHVTVSPPAASVGEKITISIPTSSVPLEKAEPHMPLRESGECNPPYPQRDAGLSLENSLQNPKFGSKSTLPVATKNSLGASVSAVEGKASSNIPSALSSPSKESEPTVPSNDGRKSEPFSRAMSVSDYKIKPDKKEQIQVQQVTQSLSTCGLPASGNGVCKTLDTETLLTTVIGDGALETVNELVPSTSDITPDASESKAKDFERTSSSSEISCAGNSVEVSIKEFKASENLLKQMSVETLEVVCQTECDSILPTPVSNEVPSREAAEKRSDEPVIFHSEVDRTDIDSDVSLFTTMDSTYSRNSQGEKSLNLGASSHRNDSMCRDEDISTAGGRSDQLPGSTQSSDLLEGRHEGGQTEIVDGSGFSISILTSKDKSLPEPNKVKSTIKSKKKRRDILQKADAAGTSDLYMAYKGPDEKKETVSISQGSESFSHSLDFKQSGADTLNEDVAASETGAPGKNEPDDWEEAADISMPKLETSNDVNQMSGTLIDDRDGNGSMAKKYSKDFLLKFVDQFTDLPQGFEVIPDLMSNTANVSHLLDRDSYPSPGKVDRTPGAGSRLDRRGSGVTEHDRWSKIPGPFISGREPRMDLASAVHPSLRPGQGPNHGVLRNLRGQTSAQYPGGILSGPMQSVNSQLGLQGNGSDADRWQRATNFQQKGLIPSPQNPLNTMHKAGKKYEVGKVSDEEQAKQRQLKAILNKLTPQNFDKLFEQVKAVDIDNAKTLNGLISQIFDKALTEPTFCEMYANFCYDLSKDLPDFDEDNEKIAFKRLLLNKCQEEFERNEREQEEANKVDEGGEIKQSEEEREEKRIKARRQMLGNIRLIGELYKKKMLTERIMHDCIKKLLGQTQNLELSQAQIPDEEDIEALCKLMSTIGEMIDHLKAKDYIDSYFESMKNLSNNMKLSSRVRFMLKDAIDLRKNKWQQRRKVEGPKKIEEVHRDAAQERHAQASRLSRGPSVNFSARRGPTMESGQRGSTTISSPNVHMAGFRGLANQVRGYGNQDVRTEAPHSYEARTLATHLPQRIGDDSITLGPQGGLARGMSIRGSQSIPTSSVAEISSIPVDSRRMTDSGNGYSSISERTINSRENPVSRYVPDRFSGAAAFDQSSAQEQSMNFGNRDLKNSDRGFDRSLQTSPTIRGQGPALKSTFSSENILSEDCLLNKSMAAIKEYYSARDEKEVALCIKELNSPSFYPSMISLWVSDSFERKDAERDLLAKLLVNLSKSSDGTLSEAQLSKGFEYVLSDLEDAVSDAPKASEYVGRMFARVIIEDVFSLGEIGRLIYEGGEEPGHLLQSGLAGDVIGNVLEAIKLEKGEGVLKDICASAKLAPVTFRPRNH